TYATAQPRQRTYDLLHVAYSLSFDEPARTVYGNVTNVIRPLRDGLTSATFDAQAMRINAVRMDGAALVWSHDGDKLTVQFGSAARTQDELRIQISYTAQPTGGLYFVSPRDAYPARTSMVYSKGEPEDNRQWLPTYDYPDDKATSECWIKVQVGHTAVSNGVLEGVEREPDGWTYHWKMNQPHATYLIAFAAGEFGREVEMLGDLPVEFYYPRGLQSQARASFAGTAAMVEFYGELTGVPYPYDRFSQLVIGDFVTGGMEHTTMVSNNISTLHEPSEKPLADSTGLVLHELAHQWFGDLVTCKDWSHMWINEGFASLMPAFWYRSKNGEGDFDLRRQRTMRGGARAQSSDSAPIVWTGYDHPYDMFRRASYAGGAARMYMLMDLIGEPTFWSGVRLFLTQYKFRSTTTDQLFNAMTQASGRDLTAFKKQWFYTEGLPRLEAVVEGTQLVLTQSTPGFVLTVPVWILDGEDWVVGQVKVDGTGRLPLGPHVGKPILVDPENRVLMSVTKSVELTPEQALAVWNHAPSASVKQAVLPAIRRVEDKSVIVGLMRAEALPRLKSSLIGQLGDGQVEYLIELTRGSDRKLANSAVSRLGSVEATDAVLARLREVMDSDTNPRIQCNALNQLVKHTEDRDLVDRAWETPAPNECFRTSALAWYVRNDKDRARELCLEQLTRSINNTIRLAAIRHLGSLKDVEGSREVYDALVMVARSEVSYRGRRAVFSALASYGDPDAIQYIQSHTESGYFRMANAAKSAVRRLERVQERRDGTR
ncbi:MAG: M1 family metallopeptidase, partial [Armatimonadetes bacterium]|nr:M1 family metallopeptidase [Armatimonadota bacterium]